MYEGNIFCKFLFSRFFNSIREIRENKKLAKISTYTVSNWDEIAPLLQAIIPWW